MYYFSPFLCIGITFATFRKSENIPLLKDTLIISLNGSDISVFNSFNVFVGMLLGLIALFGLMQLIKDCWSCWGKKVSSVIWPR